MNLRQQNIEKLKTDEYDVLIIGGGINGAVSAAALTARGVKVALIDSRDFAGFTSQHSSNLVWGGIKYMESFELGLVNNLCKSRNELLRSFPSTVKEIRFLTTISKKFRFPPLFMLVGTWLYWLFGRGQTEIPRLFTRSRIAREEPLVDITDCRGGIEYSDAYLHDNDARFVFNFVRNAMNRGTVAANYLKSIGSSRDDSGYWHTDVEDQQDGSNFTIRCKVMVNAAGAFVDEYNRICGIETGNKHLFSKGIHLIVPKIGEQHRVLAFFADDGRLFFSIPMANRTCIGTTDTIVEDPVTSVTEEDRAFVLSNINARLKLEKPLTQEDVIAERCGVRPLVVKKGQSNAGDAFQLSRKHIVEMDLQNAHISIFGGKLTDCLNVGDEVCDAINQLGITLTAPVEKWYGEPSKKMHDAYFLRAYNLGLDKITAEDTGEKLSQRLWRRYSLDALGMLDAIEQDPSLTEPLVDNTGVRYCELDYLVQNEMIVSLEDYLRRRSKIELVVERDVLKNSKGLREICKRLFGQDAEKRYREYFIESD